MAYTPNNLSVFIAAYSGALAGMAASGKVPFEVLPSKYVSPAQLAGAFAKSFDTVWGVTVPSDLDVKTIEEVCEGVWEARVPVFVPPFTLPSAYTEECRALKALILAAEGYFADEGIPTSPPAAGSIVQSKLDFPLAFWQSIIGGVANATVFPNFDGGAWAQAGAQLLSCEVYVREQFAGPGLIAAGTQMFVFDQNTLSIYGLCGSTDIMAGGLGFTAPLPATEVTSIGIPNLPQLITTVTGTTFDQLTAGSIEASIIWAVPSFVAVVP